jgi:glutamine synthetase
MSVSPESEFVLRAVDERGVRFIRLWFVDVLGLLKSVAIPVSELEQALADGVGIDGSALESHVRLQERDVIAHPDAQTFELLPWRKEAVVARMFCDIRLPDGTPFPGDSREALRRGLERAAGLGYTFQVGPEIEFFLFAPPEDGAEPRGLDDGSYFDLTTLDAGSDFRRRTIEVLEQMGIPVKASHHEVGASQHELDLAHADALSTADAVITFRLAVKEVAREFGVHATFMPKPLDALPGSAMHLHLSLLDIRTEENVFYAEDRAQALSPVGAAFLAGVLAHAPELTLITNQWVNSYKRLATGFEAPAGVGWTRYANGALVRVPSNRPDRPSSARIELRSPDPACNPYLALALILAAGLDGIERELPLPAEITEDGAAASPDCLPADLREAIDLFEQSDLARRALGERMCDWIVRNKRREWEEYSATVTEFERRRFLHRL